MFKTLYGHPTPTKDDRDPASVHLTTVYLNIPHDGKASTFSRQWRIVGLILCSFCIILHLIINPWYTLAGYLTNWTVMTTFVQLLMSYYLTTNVVSENRLAILAWYHALFEVNCGLHLSVVTLYWSLLHKDLIDKFKDDQVLVFHLYCVHSFPAIAFLIDYAMLDIKMVAWHAPYLYVPVTIVYGITNYFFTFYIMGEPLYWFITWEDYKSYVIMAVLCVAFSLIFVVLAFVVDKTCGRDTIESRYTMAKRVTKKKK